MKWNFIKRIFSLDEPDIEKMVPVQVQSTDTMGSIKNSLAVTTMNLADLMLMTATIWGEARNESFLGKQAIAHVIINRAQMGGWWGNSVRTVILKKYQFSCWNKNDPNYARVNQIGNDWKSNKIMDSKIVWECLWAALSVVQGHCPDMTYGSTHYHADYVSPEWAKGKKSVAAIGRHHFFNDVA